MSVTLISELRAIVGDDGVLDLAGDIAGYRGDLAYPQGADVVCAVRPRTAGEVSAIVTACARAGIPIVPRGGGTGLAGGATPAQVSVVVSFERMRRIRAIDPIGNTMTVEAGCTLGDAQRAARDAGRLLGLDHGGAGSSQIGGNLSTNAGGNNVLRYGMAREQVLGIEAVLADGTILDLLAPLRKNNAGYDLRHLLMGAEGTLGLITAATLRLQPLPVMRATACVGVAAVTDALAVLRRLREEFGEMISACELLPRAGLELVCRHVDGAREPFDPPAPWTLLLELDTAARAFDLPAALEASLAAMMEEGVVTGGALASSEAQRAAFWKLREGLPATLIAMPFCLKADTAVPVTAIPDFIVRAGAAVAAVDPGCTPMPFGHLGDGNIHFNVLAPEGAQTPDLMARLQRAIEDVSLELGGTVSAEHGIGRSRREALLRMRGEATLGAMRRVKAAFDPHGLFNPGKIFP
jgi:FAD/FMN-containing dehydrogenase